MTKTEAPSPRRTYGDGTMTKTQVLMASARNVLRRLKAQELRKAGPPKLRLVHSSAEPRSHELDGRSVRASGQARPRKSR
jgi:hypothetical protein